MHVLRFYLPDLCPSSLPFLNPNGSITVPILLLELNTAHKCWPNIPTCVRAVYEDSPFIDVSDHSHRSTLPHSLGLGLGPNTGRRAQAYTFDRSNRTGGNHIHSSNGNVASEEDRLFLICYLRSST